MKGRTVFVTGASRGIGKAIALRLAREGANIVIAAKSAAPHPKLPGTIYETAREVEAAGGRALAVEVDVRDQTRVAAAMNDAVERFGSLDALVNNAGAISLANVEHTPVKRYDLMQSVNARAVFVCAQAALPHMRKSAGPAHIVSLCPPLNLRGDWMRDFGPYTLSKMGMTILSLAMAAEFAPHRIAVNCLWPRTLIATAAIEFAVPGGRALFAHSRKPEIMADAVYEILCTRVDELTGGTLIDEHFLRTRGVSDFSSYAYQSGNDDKLLPDLFLE